MHIYTDILKKIKQYLVYISLLFKYFDYTQMLNWLATEKCSLNVYLDTINMYFNYKIVVKIFSAI